MSEIPDEIRLAILKYFEYFSEMDPHGLQFLGEGWDFITVRSAEGQLFRFPRREESGDKMLYEAALLDFLDGKLPLPIPTYETYFQPGDDLYPFAFGVSKFIEGIPLDDCEGEILAEDWWKQATGEFLTALHNTDISVVKKSGITYPVWSGCEKYPEPANWQDSLGNLHQVTEEIAFEVISDDMQKKIGAAFEAFLYDPANFAFSPVILHGDFNPEHVLVLPEKRQVSGIIDFGDCALGDPAFDVWDCLLPWYNRPREANWNQRREFYLRLLPIHSIIFGIEHNDSLLVEYGQNLLDYFWDTSGPLKDWPYLQL